MSARREKYSGRNLGAVYTPKILSDWLALEVKKLGFSPKVVVDPAAGDGALLMSARTFFPKSKTIGLEISKSAHRQLIQLGLANTTQNIDSLAVKTWCKNDYPKLIFANPPWGAKISKKQDREYRNQYQLATGQYDIFDLFVEKTLNEMREGDFAALFLPDSVLLDQHSQTRNMIHVNSQIYLAVKLPEGTFPSVQMGCIALIIKKTKKNKQGVLRYCRVTRHAYSKKISSAEDLAIEVKRNHFKCSQDSWVKQSGGRWLFPSPVSNSRQLEISTFNFMRVINRFSKNSAWNLWFDSGRGFEIGKNHKLLHKINSAKPPRGSVLIAVGEDVNRLSLTPSRWANENEIRTRINVKNELDSEERLFVRKTGIGLKAVVSSSIATTQTVFHFKPRDEAPDYALYYAAAFLTSPLVIAMELACSGTLEWRSHPYVTQKTIKRLPLPIPKKGTREEARAKELARLSKRMHLRQASELSTKADQIIAEILGENDEFISASYEFLAAVTGSTYLAMLVSELRKVA